MAELNHTLEWMPCESAAREVDSEDVFGALPTGIPTLNLTAETESQLPEEFQHQDCRASVLIFVACIFEIDSLGSK